jgi:hypothetical protein
MLTHELIFCQAYRLNGVLSIKVGKNYFSVSDVYGIAILATDTEEGVDPIPPGTGPVGSSQADSASPCRGLAMLGNVIVGDTSMLDRVDRDPMGSLHSSPMDILQEIGGERLKGSGFGLEPTEQETPVLVPGHLRRQGFPRYVIYCFGSL